MTRRSGAARARSAGALGRPEAVSETRLVVAPRRPADPPARWARANRKLAAVVRRIALDLGQHDVAMRALELEAHRAGDAVAERATTTLLTIQLLGQVASETACDELEQDACSFEGRLGKAGVATSYVELGEAMRLATEAMAALVAEQMAARPGAGR